MSDPWSVALEEVWLYLLNKHIIDAGVTLSRRPDGQANMNLLQLLFIAYLYLYLFVIHLFTYLYLYL